MTRLQIDMDLDNAAFEEDRDEEVASILRNLAHRIQTYGTGAFTLRDQNGNRVGECKVTDA